MRNVPPDSNQAPPFEGRNLYLTDPALQRAVACEGGGWAQERLTAWGETLGRAETFALAARANRLPPQLNTHDRFGNRIDEVAYDPSWHELMSLATREGEHCAPWVDPRGRAQVARAAAYLLHAEVENGTQCPLTMTYAAVPVLKRYAASMPAITETWLPRMLSNDYDPRTLPLADKRAALVGMGMTERQGGSDVRANATAAERCGDGSYRLAGHKWFFSAPMCDGHLVLAQAQGGLSCFLLPRLLPDGTKNAVRIQRLKDKLGNRSNASSEVEFDGATAWLLGEEGRGVVQGLRHRPSPRVWTEALRAATDANTCSPISCSKPRRRPRLRCVSRADSKHMLHPPMARSRASLRPRSNTGFASAQP